MTESAAAAGPAAGERPVGLRGPGLPRRPSSTCSGAIAYGEISAFERLAEDAKLAPDAARTRSRSATMAAAEFGHVAPAARAARRARAPTRSRRWRRSATAIDAFHAHTAPSDWYEGLIKAYVGDGLAADFYREIAAYLDADTRDLVSPRWRTPATRRSSSTGSGRRSRHDPRLGGRLALWGRRLMGEALTQAQRVAAERDALTALLAGGVDRPGLDLAAIGRMFTRLTERHAERMAELGLDS